jgi:hypothetical protein
MCHEFANSEVKLEDCDPEGWDDVESDTSEGGSNDHDWTILEMNNSLHASMPVSPF